MIGGILLGLLHESWVEVWVENVSQGAFGELRNDVQLAVDIESCQTLLFDFSFDLLAFSLDDLLGLVEVFVFVKTAEDRPGAISAGLEVRELDDKPGG